MKINYSGESSRAEYEETEAKRDSALAEVETLREERNSIEEEHRELREEFASEEPGTPYPLGEEEAEAFSRVDEHLTPAENALRESEERLKRLYNKAYDEAKADNMKWDQVAIAEADRITIEKELLPKIKEECATIHTQWEEIEHRGHWLVERADAIEKEIEEIIKKNFRMEETKRIVELIKEFWEVREEIAKIHQRALGWNIREKKD